MIGEEKAAIATTILSDHENCGAETAAVVELALTTKALVDLAGRPTSRVRGPRLLWLLTCFVQAVGPIAYLTLGRSNESDPSMVVRQP